MGLFINFIKLIKFYLGFFIKPLIILAYKLYYWKLDKTRPLPPTYNQLLFLPANKLAKKIRKREITSSELVQAYIARIEEVQPYLNCVVETCFDKALEQAKFVDEILSSDSVPSIYDEYHAPLLGVPFSCKECIWIEGMRNTSGLVARKNVRAPSDADVVRAMRKAGAILLCSTNTSELCMWMESANRLHGITRNPYNLSRIVGGSSGGEGCLIGSGASIIGLGSDIGGSIRMPAFFNGIYGHKATRNAISNDSQHPPAVGMEKDMLCTGPMCRYASDLRLMFKILVGPQVYQEYAGKFESKTELSKLNYYVIPQIDSIMNSSVSPACRNALNRAVQFLEDSLSVRVKKLNIKKLQRAFNIWVSKMNNCKEVSTDFSELMTNNSTTYKINPIIELLKWSIGQSYHTLPAIGLAILERIPSKNPQRFLALGDELKEELSAILGSNSIILFPGFPTVAPYHGQPLITNTFDFINFGIWNSMGFPVTQTPMGLCPRSGLPVGIQLISNEKCDHLTIRLAEYFEDNLIGWVAPFHEA